MTKKKIKEIVEASYIKNALNEEMVKKIASGLKRQDLKDYIKALKNNENQKTVLVTLPIFNSALEQKLNSLFLKIFPEKNVVVEIDPSLLVGLKVKNNDLIYEESLKEKLEKMLEYLKQ